MTIQESVAKKISESGNTVKETVVSALAQVEINKRVEIITSAIQKQDKLNADYNKINRNDVTTYVNGEKVEAMSDNRFKEIKKSKETIDKLTAAIDSALETNTSNAYEKLSELLK